MWIFGEKWPPQKVPQWKTPIYHASNAEDCIGVSYVRVNTFMVSKSKAMFQMIMYNADFTEVHAS